MKLELRNVKVNKALSDETNCFSATVLFDGVSVGRVMNRGNGGPHEFVLSQEDRKKLDDYAKTLPPWDFDGKKIPMDADGAIDKVLEDWSVKEQLKKWCKKEVLFRVKGDEPDAWRTLKAPFSSAAKAFLVKKYGDKLERVANEEIC